MAITSKDFESLQPGVNTIVQQGGESKRAGLEAALRQYLQKQEPAIAGQKQEAQNKANLATLESPQFQAQVNEGGSAKAGDLSVGGNPFAKQAMQGPHQAQAFLKSAQGTYKGINDQLDSAQGTLDALNQGNSTSDKLALINEARLAAGSGGSRAIAKMVDVLSGGATAQGSFQDKLNWLQNTPNIPTMQPAQRDAIREAVFNRLPQVSQQHQQAQQQLMQQGPIVAPQADTGSLINSLVSPAQQKLDKLSKMQTEYSSQRAKMQPQPSVSAPSTASPNPTTADRLRSFLGMGGPQKPLASPQQPQGPMSFEDWKKANGR